MADTKVSALSEVSVPDFSDDIYLVDNTGPTSYKVGTDRLFGLGGFIPGGRLTLTTGTPLTTSDVTAAGTIYYTPYTHNLVRVYDGTRWLYKTFSEISLSLTVTSGSNYDVFLDDDAATLVLSSAWTNDTTRADALGTQDSVKVLNSDKTKLFLGTIRASGSNVTEDSLAKRFVWNNYNRLRRDMAVMETTASWTYNTNSWRNANNSAANRIQLVTGSAETGIEIGAWVSGYGNASDGRIGIDEDASSAPETVSQASYVPNTLGAYSIPLLAGLRKTVPLGYHYYQWIEIRDGGSSAVTFEGPNQRAGIAGKADM